MDPEDLLGKNLPYAGGLRLESILGYGSFATVYKAVNKEGQVFAVKWLNKIGMSEKEQALQKDEVMYMKMLGDHKNIIHLYEVIETSDSLFLVLECCTTDLYELITQSEKQLEIPRVKRYFNEICDGVRHCHNNHIYHRDLKPENILISDDDHCKISDFGLCCFDEWTNDFNCGSLRYMSPECIDNEEDDYDDDYDDEDQDSDDNYYGRRKNEKHGLECNSKGSDVWALCVILINMIFSQNPWSSADMENPTFNMFSRKDPDVLQRKLGLSDEFNRVVKRMFSKNVYDRYSLDELRNEVNRIEVFTDFSKRVTNYLGVDEDLSNSNMSNMDLEDQKDDSQYDNIDDYDEWYQEDIYPDEHDHVVVPDIDTLELGNEEEDEENDQEPTDYSFNYLKSNMPVIGHWGDDFDDEDMASELTPKDTNEYEHDEDEEDYTSTSTSKMMISTTNPSLYDSEDETMSWENHNDSITNNKSKLEKKMDIYDSSYENKMKEWKKEEEEDQIESDDNLTTPTIDKVLSFNKDKVFELHEKKQKQTLSKKKSIQLRWEDLFDSDGEKNNEDNNSIMNKSSSSHISTKDEKEKEDKEKKEDEYDIEYDYKYEPSLPSSWNYQEGMKWGDMMDDDDFMPSKPNQEEMILSKAKPTPITTSFIEDSNEDDEGDELLFKKERVPVSSEVSSLVTPSLLTNGMQKKLLAATKKSRKQERDKEKEKEKKSSLKNNHKNSKSSKEKDKENHRHRKSKKEKDKDKEGVGAIKIKNGGKHKHHHTRAHSHTKISSSSLNEKFLRKEKKAIKLTDKPQKHRKHKTNIESTLEFSTSLNMNKLKSSNNELLPGSTEVVNHLKNNTLSSSYVESNHRKIKTKNKNKNSNKKHSKNENKKSINSLKNSKKPASVQLDWEDLFSSDGEEKTTTTLKAESIKTNNNDKSFSSIDENLEAEDEIYSLSNNIKALDIENEKSYNNSSSVNKMVDSAISVSETNLSKEIKNLNLH
ncbi:Pkinase-domain-containing protein [Anaeromyces robustus]|jgi:serine/threonine protein kinase|uniref:Pkinase-domain-containing protein n=1 Tax=Anaeromyces robustus TaxID=1754192 RepID=A0A1Y1XPH8_9FUNG|nr:Pkinase-domain-containing protein [Anaeromyces robustus]|eukprot:ORX87234.1 Pkinase-domain-containing protein [Anaeromyces robustus]